MKRYRVFVPFCCVLCIPGRYSVEELACQDAVGKQGGDCKEDATHRPSSSRCLLIRSSGLLRGESLHILSWEKAIILSLLLGTHYSWDSNDVQIKWHRSYKRWTQPIVPPSLSSICTPLLAFLSLDNSRINDVAWRYSRINFHDFSCSYLSERVLSTVITRPWLENNCGSRVDVEKPKCKQGSTE